MLLLADVKITLGKRILKWMTHFSVSHVLMTNRMTNNLEPTRFQYQNITYGDSAIPIGKSKYLF